MLAPLRHPLRRGEATGAAFQSPRPSADLVDGAHGSNGNAHFYFLKPLVTPPASFPGTFDPTQAPNVEICQWNATTSACDGADVAAFSTR